MMLDDPASAVEALSNQYKEQLRDAGLQFLVAGLDALREDGAAEAQVAIGNSAIAVELLLKALTASRKLEILFPDLPIAVRIFLAAPHHIPAASRWRAYPIDIVEGRYKTLTLEQAIQVFYVLFPQQQQELGPHLRALIQTRNVSLHAVYVGHARHQAVRAAYAASKVAITVAESLGGLSLVLKKRLESVVDEYDVARVESVRKRIEQARTKAKDIDHPGTIENFDGWESMPLSCPICGNDGFLFGKTIFDVQGSGPDDATPFLDFKADAFRCSVCDLELKDAEELRLAGMETEYDRGDDLDDFLADVPDRYNEDY